MTDSDLRRIRRLLGLSAAGLGRALGYTGSADSASRTVRRYENGTKPIPDHIAARVTALVARAGRL